MKYSTEYITIYFCTPQTVLRVFFVFLSWEQVFKIYFKDGSGGWCLPIVLVVVSVLTQAISNVFDYWLSFWSDKFLEDGAVSLFCPLSCER